MMKTSGSGAIGTLFVSGRMVFLVLTAGFFFQAYDLVLIGPYLAHFDTVPPAHRLSLIIYVTVLVYSGAIAIYYLFVSGETRPWQVGG